MTLTFLSRGLCQPPPELLCAFVAVAPLVVPSENLTPAATRTGARSSDAVPAGTESANQLLLELPRIGTGPDNELVPRLEIAELLVVGRHWSLGPLGAGSDIEHLVAADPGIDDRLVPPRPFLHSDNKERLAH